MWTALSQLVEPDERGDPMSPLRWTTRSTRMLAAGLTRQGHRIGADTVAGLLRQEGFRLQTNAKTLEGSQHADRDAEFRHLNEQARSHRKELVGDFHRECSASIPLCGPGLPRSGAVGLRAWERGTTGRCP
jgi:hypothetical protein